ncbi:asparaginase [Methyloversatilis sp.]|uniref:asparaginase n=1 Tax=Methyloversatilis sp. TaxID=2569862 RepID=UPI0027B9E2FB|nr:asparaginase [Methyloversatilis sp.]
MKRIVIFGTGGTIAGQARSAADNTGYVAGTIGVADLIAAVPPLAAFPIDAEQVAQIDSKDMTFAVWRALAQRLAHHLAREEVAGIVVTHGTDTLEETAYFLHRVLAPTRPIVLTAAMRPAGALAADGPQNLLDAVRLASSQEARGVLVCMAGTIHAGCEVRKAHPYRVNAFDSGDAGPLAYIEEGALRRLRDWPHGEALGLAHVPHDDWPRVDIVLNHAGADGALVDALCALGARGIVAAGTGNGTLGAPLEAALLRAQAGGVAVLRTSRTARGRVIDTPGAVLPGAGVLTPVQARIELMLRLM